MSARNVAYALLLVLAVAVAAGTLFLWVSSRPPQEGSAEAGFARDMMVHHAQAVEMAEIVRDRTENPQVRTLATDIALTQQAQIGQMQGWLAVWGLLADGHREANELDGPPHERPHAGDSHSQEEIDRLGTLPPEKADELFLQLMIPHHEAAIPMARAVEGALRRAGGGPLRREGRGDPEDRGKEHAEDARGNGRLPAKSEPSMDGMDMGEDHHHGG